MDHLSSSSGRCAPLQAGGQPISDTVADEAITWLTLMMSGEANPAQQQRWQQWRDSHPDHERAWQHLTAVTTRLRGLSSQASYQALSPYVEGARPGRRRALQGVALLGAFGLLGTVASRTETWQSQWADLRTATGEQRRLTLSDGTALAMDTATAVDLQMGANTRLLRLVHGAIQVTTAHRPDDARPFIVETTHGRIRALGTRFIVSQWGDGHTEVAVLEHAVEITPADGGMPYRLAQGEQASFTRTQVGAPAVVQPAQTAWLQGQLIAEDMPLGQFLEIVARHRPGLLRCDPTVAPWQISGVYPLDDTDRILRTVAAVLPIQVVARTRYWVTVRPAG